MRLRCQRSRKVEDHLSDWIRLRVNTAPDYTLNKDASSVSGRFPPAEHTFTEPGVKGTTLSLLQRENQEGKP